MGTLRANDIMPPEPKRKEVRPGAVPEGKLGVFDHRGRRVGTMGPKAGLPTAARFLGHSNAKLGTVDGRPAWVATGSGGTNKAARAQNTKLATSLKRDKGSVGKTK
jgi:hypothetical protein